MTELFFDSAQRALHEEALGQALSEALARVRQNHVAPALDAIAFRDVLETFDFAVPRSLDELCRWTIGALEAGMTHMTHPRYFGLFNPNPTIAAESADRIVAAFNPQLAAYSHAPAAVEIDAHVIQAVARRLGLPETSTGHFTSGGAEANCTAMLCALTRSNAQFAQYGARAFQGQPVLYASSDSHLAWLKIAHQTGIGRAAVRLVPTDEWGRMSMAALETAVERDRAAGLEPVMLVATAGTTNAGMIDPLVASSAMARKYGLWLHVDAAWGGGLAASPRLAHHLSGIELADSVTVDAHKWFATTMGAGMFLVRQADILNRVFHVTASYMPSNDQQRDPYVTSMQWSRRFVGLRLFLSLGMGGWNAYAKHVERAVSLAASLEKRLRQAGWQILNDSPMAVLCMIPPERSRHVADIVAAVVSSGTAWVSSAEYEGAAVVRACITHGQTTEADIELLADALVRAATG